MRYSKWPALVLSILLGAVALLPSGSVSADDSDEGDGIQHSKIGHPTWKPVDFHLFSAPIGTADDNYAEFLDTILAILPEPFYKFYPALGAGPDAPHQPPYTSDIEEGVENQRYHQGVRFRTAEWTNGKGVFVAWMNIPAPGVIGRSSDFASGPIVPNPLFPMQVSVLVYRNGEVFDSGDFVVPPLDGSIDPKFADVGGHSHFPFFVADNADFLPPGASPSGSYLYKIRILDTSGNGWNIKARFKVAHDD